jgi:hypothetical protein
MGYDLTITATQAGRRVRGISRLSDTGLFGDDYSKALRMLEAGLSVTANINGRSTLLRAA